MNDVGLISIHELLDDERYAKFFNTVPVLPDHYYEEGRQPWRLLVVVKGESNWRSKRFNAYDEALEQFEKIRAKVANAAINSPSLNFIPPLRHARVKNKVHPKTKRPLIISRVWTPQLSGEMPQHHWCGYCRRPTIFGHKAMRPRTLDGFRLEVSRVDYRCLVCGAAAGLMDIRRPQLNQPWDMNRPRFYHG